MWGWDFALSSLKLKKEIVKNLNKFEVESIHIHDEYKV